MKPSEHWTLAVIFALLAVLLIAICANGKGRDDKIEALETRVQVLEGAQDD